MLDEKYKFLFQMLYNKQASDTTHKTFHKPEFNITCININWYRYTFGARLSIMDAQSFVVGGTFKTFAKDLIQVGDILSKQETFAHSDFYSSLHQGNLLTFEEYKLQELFF